MTLWRTLRDALVGWQRLLLGRPGWRECFTLSAPGLVAALGLYLVVALLAISVSSAGYGLPTLAALLGGLFVLSLPVLALCLAVFGTRSIIGREGSPYDLLVPGIYLAAAFVIIEGALVLLGGPVVMLSWLALAFGYFRLARGAAGWNSGISASFGVLAVVLLVAMRVALYILSNPPGSPI